MMDFWSIDGLVVDNLDTNTGDNTFVASLESACGTSPVTIFERTSGDLLHVPLTGSQTETSWSVTETVGVSEWSEE